MNFYTYLLFLQLKQLLRKGRAFCWELTKPERSRLKGVFSFTLIFLKRHVAVSNSKRFRCTTSTGGSFQMSIFFTASMRFLHLEHLN